MQRGRDKDNNQHIQVYVRCRPLNAFEKKQNSFSAVDVFPDRKEIVVHERPADKIPKTFVFDKVFDSGAKQVDVYKSVVYPLIEEVLLGYNCTVFAYGQTGTGKTFTMEGNRTPDSNCSWKDDPLTGIIPRTLHQLFDELRNQFLEFSVKVSFLELYNEELFDLLSPLDDSSKMRLYEDSMRKGSVIIQGLEEVVVHNKDEVYAILEKGSVKRQSAATLLNANSSRSHTVFCITIHIKENSIDGEELLKTGKLNLVDLAGSENIGRSGAIDKRAREAGNINQSLLTLGRVITSLVERAPHIPYRESKLTRLLQDSLGGRTKTSIIATISPSSSNLEETLSTLEYAFRARNITNRPEINQKLTKRTLIKEYTEEIERLRRDLQATREKNGIYMDVESYNQMASNMLMQAEELKEKQNYIKAIKEDMEKMTELFEITKNKLQDRTRELECTQEDLKKTQTSLQNTIKTLGVTSTQRDEQQHLVQSHLKTETVLTSQATELLTVAEEASSDVVKLHQKIERKAEVENNNERSLHNFNAAMTENLNNLKAMAISYGQNQSQFCDDLATNLGKNLECRKQECDALVEQLASLSCVVMNKCEKLDTTLAAHSQETIRCSKRLLDSTKSCKEKQLKHLKTFEDATLVPIIASLVDILNRQGQCLQHARVDIISKVEELRRDNEVQMDKQLAAIQETSEEVSRHVQSIAPLLHSSRSNCQSIQSSTETYRKEQEKDIRAIQQLLGNVLMRVESHRDEIVPISQKIEKDTAEVENSNSALHNMLTSHAKGLQDLSNTTKLTVSRQMETLKICADEEFEGGIHLNKMAHDTLSHLQQENLNLVQEAQSAWEDHFGTIEQLVQEQDEAENSQSQEERDQTQIILSTVKTGVEAQMAVLKHQETDYGVYVCERQEELRNRGPIAADALHQMTDEIHEINRGVDNLVNKEVKKDVPTGTTPQRREFLYPRTLAATSPHDRILGRLRSKIDLQTASNSPLPEDSWTEQEQKCAIDQTSTSSKNDSFSSETSSTNENEYKDRPPVSLSLPVKKQKSVVHRERKKRPLVLREQNSS